MFDSIAQQMREHLLTGHELTSLGRKRSSIFRPKYKEDLSLDCTVQNLVGSDRAGLISRVSYRFLAKVPATLEDVFRYVAALNSLLVYSQVFVVQDLDGDGSYYLRMDTIIKGDINRKSIYKFLDNITEDVRIILTYFNHQVPQQAPCQEQLDRSPIINAFGLNHLLSKCG